MSVLLELLRSAVDRLGVEIEATINGSPFRRHEAAALVAAGLFLAFENAPVVRDDDEEGPFLCYAREAVYRVLAACAAPERALAVLRDEAGRFDARPAWQKYVLDLATVMHDRLLVVVKGAR